VKYVWATHATSEQHVGLLMSCVKYVWATHAMSEQHVGLLMSCVKYVWAAHAMSEQPVGNACCQGTMHEGHVGKLILHVDNTHATPNSAWGNSWQELTTHY